MTAEPSPARFRTGKRGRVHEVIPGMLMTARCGVLIDRGWPTDEPVDCRTCLGDRVWRGQHSIRPAVRRLHPTLPLALDLRRSDRALTELEELNEAAHNAWRDVNGYPRGGCSRSTPKPPEAVFGPPPDVVAGLIAELEMRYEQRLRRGACRTTVTAHEELLRLQGYLLPNADREAS